MFRYKILLHIGQVPHVPLKTEQQKSTLKHTHEKTMMICELIRDELSQKLTSFCAKL